MSSKTWEARRKNGTDKCSVEQRKRISETLKNNIPWNKGLTIDIDSRIISTKGRHWKCSDIARENISRSLLGNKRSLGFKHSEESKRKIREYALKRAQENGLINIGKNETQLLNEQEIKDSCKIIRQYKILGYSLDGYCKETNTVYEVYEQKHFRKSIIEKDLKRQKEIEDYLKCKFIIIEDK